MTWEERGMASEGVEITGPQGDRYDEVLTPEALDLIAALQRELGARRAELLAARAAAAGGAVGRAGRSTSWPATQADPGRPGLAGGCARARAWWTAGSRSPARPTGR